LYVSNVSVNNGSRAVSGSVIQTIAYINSNGENTPLHLRGNIPLPVRPNARPAIPLSAKTGAGIDKLLDKIISVSVRTPPSGQTVVITNERHENELLSAKSALCSIAHQITQMPLDMVSVDITTALNHIGTITGTNVTEATLDAIFSKFCLGK
jgi:tRNA modification GTPase